MKAYTALAEAFADPSLKGTPEARLTEAMARAGLDPAETGTEIAAFIDLKGLRNSIPADLLQTYSQYSEVLKAEAEAERDREKASLRVMEAEGLLQQIRENLGRGVLSDDPDMSAKLSEAAGFLADIGAGKGKPTEHLASFLSRKYTEDNQRRSGDLLGFPLGRFEYLARRLDGIQPGFYIAAAETNIGKTAFLANVFLDALDTNQELAGLYVSLDDPKGVIVDRFTSILARLAYCQQEGENADAYARSLATLDINGLRKNLDHDQRRKTAKERAAAKLSAWASAGRLDIRDITELPSALALERCVRGIARGGRQPFVVIDALFNLDIGGDAGGTREENIERAQFLKKLSDEYTIPIWTTAEIRKKPNGKENAKRDFHGTPPTTDDIMESSKYAYNANAVFMLYPEAWEDFTSADQVSPYLVIDIQKNKLSDFKRPIFASFTKRAAFMELDPDHRPTKKSKPEPEAKAKTAGPSDKELR